MTGSGCAMVRTHLHEGVAWVIIDNQAKANSLGTEVIAGLQAAWAWAESDPSVRVVVLTGAGERHFCGGADVSALGRSGAIIDTMSGEGGAPRLSSRQAGVNKPVIAAVNGVAVGGGITLAADADIVVAAEHAVFRDGHVALGYPAGHGLLRLAGRIGLGEATRLAVAGAELSAQRAYELGFVSELCTGGDATRDAAGRLADAIAACSPTAVALTLDHLRRLHEDQHSSQVITSLLTAVGEHRNHPDALEGPKAWMERRPPRWAKPARTNGA
jgi:enoyl-CoA hydratase/carnithine racemase